MVTGVNLPMLIKAGQSAGRGERSSTWRASCASTGATPSGSPPTCWSGSTPGTPGAAARRHDSPGRDDSQPTRTARARRRQVRARGRHASVAGSACSRDGRTMDGKSIMGILLLAAAQGTTVSDLGRRARRSRGRRRRSSAISWKRVSGRNRGTPDRHRRLSWHRRRTSGGADPAHRSGALSGRRPIASSASWRRSISRASGRASSCSTSGHGWPRGPVAISRRCSTRSC